MGDLDPVHMGLAEKVAKHGSLFRSAWYNLKEELANGIVNYPDNEHELSSLLFAKCLELMKKERFATPYQIHAEDVEIYAGNRADLTLGDLKEVDSSAKAVTVEIKHNPSSQKVMSDIMKLQRYIADDKLFHAFFVAIGDIALEKLKPRIVALGIAEKDIDMVPGRVPSSKRRKLALLVSLSP